MRSGPRVCGVRVCLCVSVSEPLASSLWPWLAPRLRSAGWDFAKQLWEQADGLSAPDITESDVVTKLHLQNGLLLALLFNFDFCSPERLHDNP